MEERIHYTKVSQGAYHALLELEKYMHECGLEEPLLNLVKLRHLRSRLRVLPGYALERSPADRESEQRLYSLDAWRSLRTTAIARSGAGVDRSRDPCFRDPRAG